MISLVYIKWKHDSINIIIERLPTFFFPFKWLLKIDFIIE